jgi:hypothetical protein
MKFSDAPRHRFCTETVLSITTLIVVAVLCLTFQHLNLKKKAAVKSAALPVQHKNGAGPTVQLTAEDDAKANPPMPLVQGNGAAID